MITVDDDEVQCVYANGHRGLCWPGVAGVDCSDQIRLKVVIDDREDATERLGAVLKTLEAIVDAAHAGASIEQIGQLAEAALERDRIPVRRG